MTPEEEKKRLLSIVDSASQHGRRIYYLYIGFLAYCILTVASTTDRQLAIPGEKAQLPILDVGVSLEGFFLIAPAIAIFLFVYFMTYLVRLKSLISELGEDFNKRLLFPWMFNIAVEPDKKFGAVAYLQKYITSISLWFTLPTTLFIFALKFVKKHEDYSSYLIVALPFISIYIVVWFRNKLSNDKQENSVIRRHPRIALAIYIFIAFLILCCTFIMIPIINKGYFAWANLDLQNKMLIRVPRKEEEKFLKNTFWVNLKGVNLSGANLAYTVLKQANLQGANLRRAILEGADLRGSNLGGADLEGAILWRADLREVKNITYDQLCKAYTLYNTQLDVEKLKAVQKKCPDVLVNLVNAKLEGADLEGASLRRANLEGANLEGANLEGADLWEASLVEASLYKANLEGANLEGANLERANLEGANLGRADLGRADLRRAILEGAILGGADLWEASLVEANLERANLEGANLGRANLERANLEGANLEGADLGRADLRRAILEGAILGGANLGGADLRRADLRRAILEGAILGGANLGGANLGRASLVEANLEGASLYVANLWGASLYKANLVEASLYKANLEGADLERADLRGAKKITSDQLCKAKTLHGAQLDVEMQEIVKKECPELLVEPQ